MRKFKTIFYAGLGYVFTQQSFQEFVTSKQWKLQYIDSYIRTSENSERTVGTYVSSQRIGRVSLICLPLQFVSRSEDITPTPAYEI